MHLSSFKLRKCYKSARLCDDRPSTRPCLPLGSKRGHALAFRRYSLSAIESSSLRRILVDERPMIDVRAPIEFSDGAFPSATNLPIMVDEERRLVGIAYKREGREAAIALGHRLVSSELRGERIKAWADFIKLHPNAIIYCFRGGLRSQISQTWIHEALGVDVPRVGGGFKEMRRFLLSELETISPTLPDRCVLLGGRTGSGKTHLLDNLGLASFVDLEGLAVHRGSAFGNRVKKQPAQIAFEHSLSIGVLRAIEKTNHLLLEDESRYIGSVSIPELFYQGMAKSPVVVLDVTLAERTETTLKSYVLDSLSEFEAKFGQEAGFIHWQEYLLNSLRKIQKKLGLELHASLEGIMKHAFEMQQQHGSVDLHRDWISVLISKYYDPQYSYQIETKRQQGRVIFEGRHDAVCQFLRTRLGQNNT